MRIGSVQESAQREVRRNGAVRSERPPHRHAAPPAPAVLPSRRFCALHANRIMKIKKHYQYDEDSCLLELMLEETNKGKSVAAEGVLWLNRALLFFELTFKEMLPHLKSEQYDVNMKKIFISAYEGSVKKYHSWITQQLFNTICKMSPSMPQILKSFQVDNNVKAFESRLSNFNDTLHLVRSEIDSFFEQNNLFNNNNVY